MPKPRGPDTTNAERQRRYRAKRSAALRAIRNGSNGVTSQAIEKPPDVTRNAPIYTQSVLPLDSLLSLQEKTSAREVGLNPTAPLTEPCRVYARDWANWDDVRAAHEWERFRSYYVARGRQAYSWWAMWQSWVQNGMERDAKRADVGSIPWQIQQKERTLHKLQVMQGGKDGVQLTDGESMRRKALEGLADAYQSGHERVGQGGNKPVLRLLGGGGSKRD